jgi:phosphoserine aminotransferase
MICERKTPYRTTLPMTIPVKPSRRPRFGHFSSGPCAKRPGWTPDALAGAALGRSHRSSSGKAKLGELIDRTRAILGIPDDYRLGIVPASDTGAFEMALWSLLGPRGVDVFAWESFGETWIADVVEQLKLDDVRTFAAPYGGLPDLSQANPDRDIVFTWNGTTSGVRVPDGGWIKDGRRGLTICDATSAAFAMDLPWRKLDVTTWSWQKVLGGEAQHGMLALSPRAVERLQSYAPPWPMPKIFRLTQSGKLIEGVFKGETINTPSMLAVEDQLDALRWAEKIGGLPALIGRCEGNLAAIEDWITRAGWIGFLAADKATRSCTSVCLKIVDPAVARLDAAARAAVPKKLVALLEAERVAYDIDAYRHAPPGLRIWAGTTVETDDLQALFPWLDWAYAQVAPGLQRAAAAPSAR